MVIYGYQKLHRIQETSFNTSKLSERPKDSWLDKRGYLCINQKWFCSYIAAKLLHMLKSTKQNYDANICN